MLTALHGSTPNRSGVHDRVVKPHHKTHFSGHFHTIVYPVSVTTDTSSEPFFMPVTQFFPIPPELLALACETVNRRVDRLPFTQGGCTVTQELIGVTMECLNAEWSKTLALHAKQTSEKQATEGLDLCLAQRLDLTGDVSCAAVIADVLCRAGMAEKSEVADSKSHARSRGVRLEPAWTWHSSSAPVSSPSTAGADTQARSSLTTWMSLCPICRTGILNQVFGKQLYGIPHTDYYVECTHCGSKFIAEKDLFCLVSIATIRDPSWKSFLNRSYSPESWMEIARASGTGTKKPVTIPVTRRPSSPPQSGSQLRSLYCTPVRHPSSSVLLKAGPLTPMRDGSLGVPIQDKILYFKPVRLIFAGGLKEDVFEKEQRFLKDALSTPAYSALKAKTEEKYANYLPLRLGLFCWERKEKHDPFYREFLNPWGDEKFGTFMVEDSDLSGRNGVYLVVADGKACHAGYSSESFKKTLTAEFSRITAGDCYLDRDGTRCRINALLCQQKKTATVYLHAVDKEEERVRITEALMSGATVHLQ
ncbi:MAG: hypothetical protein WCF90_00490 [Methanomicrobiales archaeon]